MFSAILMMLCLRRIRMRNDQPQTICFPPSLLKAHDQFNKVYTSIWVSNSRQSRFAGRMTVGKLRGCAKPARFQSVLKSFPYTLVVQKPMYFCSFVMWVVVLDAFGCVFVLFIWTIRFIKTYYTIELR